MAHNILGMAKVNLRVNDLPAAMSFFEAALQGEPLHDRGNDTIGEFDGATIKVGDTVFDIMAPNNEDGALARSIEKRGEGMDSVAFMVEDLEATAEVLREQGIELVNRADYHGAKIGFIHPRSSFGMLIELIERPAD